MLKQSITFFLFILLISHQVFGQDTITRKKTDTIHVYNRIERFSNQRKITRLLFPLFFRPTETKITSTQIRPVAPAHQETYCEFEGKIIRKITIVTADPFGFDVNDSLKKPRNFPERFGNELHIKSLPITIRNYLLIRRNEPFDSLLVTESERLVRKQRFVRDISLVPILTPSDSVDILIRVQDVWSIVPDGSVSTNSFTLKIQEDNFLGTGNQFKYIGDHDINLKKGAYEVGYVIPNIDNSYITASIGYVEDEDKSYSKSLSIDRSFYSPYARWAGCILIKQQYQKDSLILSGSNRIQQIYKLNTYDYWAGSAWQFIKGRSEADRNTNLII